MNEEIKNKLQRGLALTVKESWDLYKHIEALEQQTCEDCVSREEVLKAFAEKCAGECACCEYNGSGYDTAENCKLIKSLPSVTPQPKTGKWIHREDFDYIDIDKVVHEHYMCKDCGLIHDFIDGHTGQYNYCPQCGAKMEVEE